MFKWEKYNKNTYRKFFKKKILSNKKKKFNFIESNFYTHIRDLFAITLTLISSAQNKINVLDLGGGSGVSLFNLKNKIDTAKFFFYIYDPYTDFSKNLKIKKINYSTSNTLETFKNINFDLVYFGSSYQYINDFNIVFNKINLKKKSFILFTHTPFSIFNSFKTAQMNKKNLTQNIYSFSKVLNFFNKFNFHIIFKSLMNNKYSGVQKKFFKKIIYCNLLFKRE
jgi:putative methyltransferase (TIGR04325 family)